MDDRRRDGETNYTLRTKEQVTHLTLNEHEDDDEKCLKEFEIWSHDFRRKFLINLS